MKNVLVHAVLLGVMTAGCISVPGCGSGQELTETVYTTAPAYLDEDRWADINITPYCMGSSRLHRLIVKTIDMKRGQEAYNLIKADDPEAQAPPDGYEYIVAEVHALLTAFPLQTPSRWFDEHILHLTSMEFNCFAENGEAYARAAVKAPQPEFNVYLEDGQEGKGFVVFTVLASDVKPRMLFSYENINFWFALY